MGVYHFMGLGRAPGAITGPISYLANRYSRWNNTDKDFFSGSGESARFRVNESIIKKLKGKDIPKNIISKLEGLTFNKAYKEEDFENLIKTTLQIDNEFYRNIILECSDMKMGDVQAIVFFSTKELYEGIDKKFLCFDYILNTFGKYDNYQNLIKPENSVKNVLLNLLPSELSNFNNDRKTVDLYWIEIDRRDFKQVFDRVIEIVLAFSSVGGQGKEIWCNLTGGTNIINYSLQLASVFTGDIARLYYVQSTNEEYADKCIRYHIENENVFPYWIEIPIFPTALNPIEERIIQVIEEKQLIHTGELFNILNSEYYTIIPNSQSLMDNYLKPLWKQGFIKDEGDDCYSLSKRWREVKKPLEDIKKKKEIFKKEKTNIEDLIKKYDWIKKDKIEIG